MYEKLNELEARIIELERISKNQIRVGEVTQRKMEKCQVRVKFKDEDGEISYWCSILVPKAHSDQFYWLPDIGDLVICIFLPWDIEKGYVVGCIYNEKDQIPPEATLNTMVMKDSSGNMLLMDRSVKEIVGKTKTFRIVGDLVVHGEIISQGNMKSNESVIAQNEVVDELGSLTYHTNEMYPRDPGDGAPELDPHTFDERYGCCGCGSQAGTCGGICRQTIKECGGMIVGTCGNHQKNEKCQCGRSSCNCPGNCTCQPRCTCEHCLGGGES